MKKAFFKPYFEKFIEFKRGKGEKVASSTLIRTQYRKDDWVNRLGEGVRAEAIVDRYAYTAFWIETGSTNMREYCAKHKR